MAKLTGYQMNMLKAIGAGSVMLRGRFDRYFWQETDQLCSAAARRLRSKGLIKNVYLNSVRDMVELTAAGRAAIGLDRAASGLTEAERQELRDAIRGYVNRRKEEEQAK